MRDDHEKKEVLEIRKDFYRLHHHARRANCLQRQQRQRKHSLTADEHKEGAQKSAEKILSASDRFRENQRVDPQMKVSGYRVSHNNCGEDRESE